MEEKLLAHDYYVCEKTDGLRVLMFIVINPVTGEQGCFMIDREITIIWLMDLGFPDYPKRRKKSC